MAWADVYRDLQARAASTTPAPTTTSTPTTTTTAPKTLASSLNIAPTPTMTKMAPTTLGASLGLGGPGAGPTAGIARRRGGKGMKPKKGMGRAGRPRAGLGRATGLGPAMPIAPGGTPPPAGSGQAAYNEWMTQFGPGAPGYKTAQWVGLKPPTVAAQPGRYGTGFGGEAGRGVFQPGAPIGGQAPQSLASPVPIQGPTTAVTKDPRLGTSWWGQI